MGYTKINLSTGYTCLAPAFSTVGADTIDLAAMEVIDGIDADNLSLLDSTGNVIGQYFWWNEFNGLPAMWSTDSLGFDEAVGVSLNQMEGFLLFSNASAAQLMHSGEVLEDDIEDVALNTGYTTLGNPYNKALPLENLAPVNAVDADNLSLLDSTGNVVEQYFWWNEFNGLPAMWSTDSLGFDEAVGVTLDPSEAFLLFSNASSATLDVTAP